jgi:hypothetical protein
MATRSTAGAAAKAARAPQTELTIDLDDRPSASLRACIEGLQFILSLSSDEKTKKDPLLEVLVPAVRRDLLKALGKIHGGDDTGKTTNPDED